MTLKRKIRSKIYMLTVFLAVSSGLGHAVPWLPFGPDGGDARSLAADPHDHLHLYLGTANGWIYDSHDGGKSWGRLARVGKRDDLALDNIVIDGADAKHIVVGAWVLGRPDGGLFVSHDGGLSWASNKQLAGESIRALAAAPSDSKIMVAGTLKGVYRSVDGGSRWELISPEGSQEIHEVESIAIDPADPNIIYAGTWHLPWKTVDAGEHWNNIKEGVIEDSDVFSIIVDPKEPSVVYASACSGIYKSDNSGVRFRKIQGIPSTARRTRVLMQDPEHLETVFAGTTEGLFRTDDSGGTWIRTTGPEVIVNDVYVDPSDSNHVLLATDRGGVLVSRDRGNSFEPSNNGFSARQITSYVAEAQRPAYVYVGVVNDKESGGVFASENGGLSWVQESAGLLGRDVFSLGQASDGTIIAGTGHGIYRLHGAIWSRVGDNSGLPVPEAGKEASATDLHKVQPLMAKQRVKRSGKLIKPVTSQKASVGKAVKSFDGSVYSIAQAGDRLYAATSEGLLRSGTAGESWEQVDGLYPQGLQFVAVAQSTIVAADLKSMTLSADGGRVWATVPLPPSLTQISAVTVDDMGGLWVGGREGLFVSKDKGAMWETLKNLFIGDVNSIFYDQSTERVLITTGGKGTMAFAVHVPDRSVRIWDTGWNLRFVRPVGDHMIGASLFDGIVVQPQMVDSREVATH
jgi:photosystem II stability/assembly factor-like uncharacterized protein